MLLYFFPVFLIFNQFKFLISEDKFYLQAFGETFIDDDMFIAYAFSTASICNALARVGWGILADRTSFQVSLSH